MAFLGDHDARAMRRAMGALAAEIMTDGQARLTLARGTVRYIEKAGERVNALMARTDSAQLTRLYESLRPIEACARQARLDGGLVLPSCEGETRVEIIAREIISDGDAAPDVASLMLAVAAFDDVQSLTMAEYWAVPEAMRVAVCRAWARAAQTLIRASEARAAAEDWVYSGGPEEGLAGRDSAFYERALQLALEIETPDVRARLEHALSRQDMTPEECVRRAHETGALCVFRVDNLMAVKRMLDAADWQSAFESVSRTETELAGDPAGVYPAMTRESRAAVREQVARLARALNVGETTVARYAVKAAGESSGVRGGVCWWLYEDEGRRALAGRLGVKPHLPLMHRDARGAGLVFWITALSVALTIGLARVCGAWWSLFAVFPLSWGLVTYVVSQYLTRAVRPRRLLRMEMKDGLPDSARTLVVIPALITSKERARGLCSQLETLGCLEKDKNIDFLLLGDFRDAQTAECEGDGEILDAARECIAQMNRRAERSKYHFLHRARELASADGIYRGRARKRGALMALGALLTRGEDAFLAEGGDGALQTGNFRYVVTLDADTTMLPGTVRRLVGTLAHPLNAPHEINGRRRGYAVLQPCVELDPAQSRSGFVRLFAGVGGMSAYSVMVSDLYQDLTGRGNYCGKGVIDMPAFTAALENKLDDGRILSHDLIEGMLAGAGHVNDVSFFDGHPATFAGWLSRLERWTRGDWQLLPDVFRRDIGAFDRFRLIANLIESLWEPALVHLLIVAIWLGARNAFAVGIIFALVRPLFSRALGDREAFRRGCLELALLPATAYTRAAAIWRALLRTFITKKKLLDWVTSADAAGDARVPVALCRAGAVLLIPGLFYGAWVLPTLALGALFVVGPSWVRELEETDVFEKQPLTPDMTAALLALSRDTWRFFTRYVDESGHFLPPDNVQIDPDVGAARRTSPTNIAMYMLSCVAAREMGFIEAPEMDGRIADTLGSLEAMEKWNGHIYNWYSIDDLSPLRPRYVSAVDSGNLSAALLLCAEAVTDSALKKRLRAFAQATDLASLYDAGRQLFYIGADVEHGRMSASHYDLLASESRILTYAAMMLGQVSDEAWKKLSRPVSDGALLSWSGTMFEYFMPALFMRSAPGTLLGASLDRVVRVQSAFASARVRPWGVSESGYCAFDMSLNYQYRAFGMRALAMGGPVPQEVVAPYAACLALASRPADAAKNIMRMLDMGWAGECGLYEAADYTRREPRLVKSWMSHHQGMALCALCNALTGDSLVRYFMNIHEAQALRPLLNERAAARIRLDKKRDIQKNRRESPEVRRPRPGRPSSRLCDAAILGGAGAAAFVTARGDMAYWRRGVFAARFTGDLLRRGDSIFTVARDIDTGKSVRINSPAARSAFEPGEAVFTARLGGAEIVMRVCVSPEDGALVRSVCMTNHSQENMNIEITDAFETAMMDAGEMRSHPAFFRLFCRADLSRPDAIIYRRRERSERESHMALFHAASMAVYSRETDWLRLVGRMGYLAKELRGPAGAQVDPCSALRCRITLEGGQTREMAFAMGLVDESEVLAAVERHSLRDSAVRALRLASAHTSSMAEYVGLDAEKRQLAERCAAFVIDPRLARRAGAGGRAAMPPVPADLPLVCVTLDSVNALSVLRDAIRFHEYCRLMGVIFHLAAVNDYGNDYSQPVRDGIEEMIGAGYLRDLRFERGGVSVFDAEGLGAEGREALNRSACLNFDGRSPFWAQARRALMALEYVSHADYAPMPAPMAEDGEEYGRAIEGGYEIYLTPERVTPAPWSNVICSERMGAMVTERGGGFMWHLNSRLRRVTNFDNDPACDGWSVMTYVSDERKGLYMRGMPGDKPLAPYTVRHMLWESAFLTRADGLDISTEVFADTGAAAIRYLVTVKNLSDVPRDITVTCFCDWLMGADGADACRVRAWSRDGALLASGAIDSVGYMACDAPGAESGPERAAFLGLGGVMRPDGLMERVSGGGWALRARVTMEGGGTRRVCFTIGCEADADAACAAARTAARDAGAAIAALEAARLEWENRRAEFSVETGDENLDFLINGFMPKQVLDGRVRARAGFYQAGGAFGFRDQLQDMLSLLPYDAERVRGHILTCAEHQFLDGDVMHWWHAPAAGVRTRISDDLLFLPLVTAAYVNFTGDDGILNTSVGYLENEDIPAGAEDWYGPARLSGEAEDISAHCMRAFKRAYRCGAHGLLLMGTGDWNDGMSRVGAQGKGESVWLTMFFAVCADAFAPLLPEGGAREWLRAAAADARRVVEESGWDGSWYRRAYDDNGRALGADGCGECRIDLISQAWAVLAGLNPARAQSAMQSARDLLFMKDEGIIRLLTPPFTGAEFDPGYIAAYPPGVRENGGQYTHAACWYLLAASVMGDAHAVREALTALLPINHALTREMADVYRVEPYVIAADIYSEPPFTGRGGWTWYTGAAGWLMCAVRSVIGFERRGSRIKIAPLRGVWENVKVTVKYRNATYVLTSSTNTECVTIDGAPCEDDMITMTADGAHVCEFPMREGRTGFMGIYG